MMETRPLDRRGYSKENAHASVLAPVHNAAEIRQPYNQILKPKREMRSPLLDAYRGFVMLIMIPRPVLPSAIKHPGFGVILHQFDHVEWEGMVLWDLIEPMFLFAVGMAMALAFARREEQGATPPQLFKHVIWRTLKLILISQVLWSIAINTFSFQLINVLSQIALAYFLTFLILQLPLRWQVASAVVLTIGYWGLFAMFPGTRGAFSKSDNVGVVLDRMVLGFNYSDYYVTSSFIGGTVTMLFGSWAGRFLTRQRSAGRTLWILIAMAALAFSVGLALRPFNPMIKRVWTASFTLISGGWTLLVLAAFYWIVEIRQYRKLVFPLVVVGANSIFVYCFSTALQGWLGNTLRIFTRPLQGIGALAPGIANLLLFVGVNWYLCYWLYRRRIFIKL